MRDKKGRFMKGYYQGHGFVKGVSQGYGFHKGRIPQNKLNLDEKRIIEMYEKENISGIKIAKYLNCDSSVIYDILRKNHIQCKGAKYFNKNLLSGDKNPMKRPEIKAKVSKKVSKSIRAKWKNEEYRKKLSGKNANLWKGGISPKPYEIEFNNELKEQIRERDNHTCQECGFNQEQLGRKLDVHHINFNKKNNPPNNLISLCRSCHTQTQFNRQNWTNYFQNKINGGQNGISS